MKSLKLAVIALGFSATAALAAPTYLVTHNKTNVDSNAFIDGVIPSPHPTKANSDGRVSWFAVKLACSSHVSTGICPALIKMATNTANPVNLGTVYLNLTSGDITPKSISANGYTMIVNGPGEATVSKN